MTSTPFPQPHLPNIDEPDEVEPGVPPVEPDEGPTPAFIPDDPEYERVLDPSMNRAAQAQRSDHPGEVTRCP